MEFKANQPVMFLCNDTTTPTWQKATYQKRLDSGVHQVKYQGRLLAAAEGNVLRLTLCSDNQVEAFGNEQFPSLVKFLKQGIADLKVATFCGEVTVDEDDKVASIMGGGITIQPGILRLRHIGGFREIPCWTVSGWKHFPATRHEPDEVDEISLGESMSSMAAAKIAIEQALKSHVSNYFDSLGEALAYEQGEECWA